MQYSLSEDHQYHKWLPQKSWMSYPDCQDAQDKQLTQYLLIFRSKWKMLTNYWKIQNRSVQTFGFVYHDTKWPKSWSSMEDQVVPLERNLYGHPLSGLLWEKAIWENPINARLGESFQLGMPLFIVKKDYSYLCMWMWMTSKFGWKETKSWSDVGSTQ